MLITLLALLAFAATPAAHAATPATKAKRTAKHTTKQVVAARTAPPELSPVGAATCADADLRPAADTLARIQASELCLLNAERTSRGVGALTLDPTLVAVAQARAADLVARNYFQHTSPGGTTFEQTLIAAGYVIPGTRFSVGENLAWGQTSLGTPLEVVRGWMNSPGHRANILRPRFSHTGLGAVVGVPKSQTSVRLPGATYVQEFGDRHVGAIG